MFKLGSGILSTFFLAILINNSAAFTTKDVTQTVPVEIYDNFGNKTGETTITIHGIYHNSLFQQDEYKGVFSVPDIPETEQEDTIAQISWNKRKGYPVEPIIQHFRQNDDATSYKYEYDDLGTYSLEISEDMTEIVWCTKVGVVTTSYEAYQNSIFFDENNL